MSEFPESVRTLYLVLGDQLDRQSPVFRKMNPKKDAVWMAEVEEEADPVWSHKMRIAFFFSAMRHFRDALLEEGIPVVYSELPSHRGHDRGRGFTEVLAADLKRLKPRRLAMVVPGDSRVLREMVEFAKVRNVTLEILEDEHFYCCTPDFEKWSNDKKSYVMETFYRWMRVREGILVDSKGRPEGGEWNYDKENRESFGSEGPGKVPAPKEFKPDQTTREVLRLMQSRYSENPGSLDHFNLPVTRDQALAYLDDFIGKRLPLFGPYEDAMWRDETFLYHSRLSALLNVKLLNPRECVDRAVQAYSDGQAPIQSVEGFVRQILGWREFIRGIYWNEMPRYIHRNALRAQRDVPRFFWDGQTDMECVRQSMSHVIRHGYAHHIHRLMVLGLFAQLYGVHPKKFHDWHMAMYVDAVDWVSLPNTLGMSQYGDGGIVGTKPYCASGKYIKRMGNFCSSCRYNPDKATGRDACPFTTLYWDFLDRHRKSFANNPRMAFQMKNLELKDNDELTAIRSKAHDIFDTLV